MQFKDYPVPSKDSIGSGANNFLKIPSGDSVRGVFRGDIHEFWSIWQDGKPIVTDESDPGAKRRFRVNFVTEENGGMVSKIWEFGILVYNQLREINSEYSLETTKIKITRDGTGKDTSYVIMPLVSDSNKLTPKQLERISSVDLLPLEKKKPQPQHKTQNDSDFGF